MITRKPNKLPQLQTIAFQDFQTLSNDFTSQPFQSTYIFFSRFHLYYYPAHISSLLLLLLTPLLLFIAAAIVNVERSFQI